MQEPFLPESGGRESPGEAVIRVFTTRPDTLFGATYMVLAPEHPLVPLLTVPAQKTAVEAYVKATAAKSDVDRMAEGAKQKSGVFTGSHAINPVNGQKIPIWAADYVLKGDKLGTTETGKLADLVLWDPRFFGIRPQVVMKGGALVWGALGDPNASIPTPQPQLMRATSEGFSIAQVTFQVQMTPEMWAGWRPDSGRLFLAPRIPLPVSQTTHVENAFTSSMVPP